MGTTTKQRICLPFLVLGIVHFAFAQQSHHSEELIPVASFGKSMAIGLSVSAENRIFVAFPNYDGNDNLALAEVRNGQLHAYPDTDWNVPGGGEDAHFVRVQDLFVDADDNLWVLDSKPSPGSNIFGDQQPPAGGQFKLVKVNTKNDTVEAVFHFDDLDKLRSALNDVRVDVEKNLAYLSDPGLAAIVVLDLSTGRSRALLEGSAYTLADDIALTYDGVEMRNREGKPFSSHVNGIALTHDFKYFYFKPINKENLYRIETVHLADTALSPQALEGLVENRGEVGITHGLIADKKGNIYLTTSTSYSISYLSAEDGKVYQLVQDARLLWPDSFGIGTDGYLYFTCAQLQRLPQWNDGTDKTEYPYTMYKVKLPE